jgi:GNAT superfamily N-acetyltransferase
MNAPAHYQTRELSHDTWQDFEKLFSRGNGWDHCWCVAFQRLDPTSRKTHRNRAEAAVSNRVAKKDLVDRGRAHGILVYADGDPVGWCQYGSSDELNGRRRPESATADDAVASGPVWRVTCFVVDKRHKRKGVASLALRAALASIRRRGGGLVEAFPIACWTHGRGRSEEPVYVQGVGPVAPAWGGFGNVSTSGIVSMFEKEGFKAVAVCGSISERVRTAGAQGCHVLMRKMV